MSANVERALGVLRDVAGGAVDRSSFAPDARWWSVTGQSFSIKEFLAILSMLHARTIGGIVIDTGLVIDNGDQVIVEGTSDVPLIDGGRYANRYLFLIHFHDGLIREVREYNDSAHLAAVFKLDTQG